jgi:hypothetical protein
MPGGMAESESFRESLMTAPLPVELGRHKNMSMEGKGWIPT